MQKFGRLNMSGFIQMEIHQGKGILKPFFTLLLVAVIALLLFNLDPSTATAVDTFAEGDGSEGDPYQVATAEQLNNVRNNLDKHFIQTANIDLNVSPYDAGNGWVPIDSFVGSYDGDGYTISNLFIDNSVDGMGLFGSIGTSGNQTALVENVTLVNVDIKVNGESGSLAGINYGTVGNCHVSGTVSGSADRLGGLVGINQGTVENSSANVNVNGIARVGGLVGTSQGASIIGSWAEGDVYGQRIVGGLVGKSRDTTDSDSIIENCYAEGDVTGIASTGRVGGLVGVNWGAISESHAKGNISGGNLTGGLVGESVESGFSGGSAVIDQCYATGAVVGENTVGGLAGSISGIGTIIRNSYATSSVNGNIWVGGLVGYNDRAIINSYAIGPVEGESEVGGLVGQDTAQGSITNSYYDRETTGQEDTGKGIPKTTQEMQSGSPSVDIYTDWSKDIWTFTPTDKYPWLDEPYSFDPMPPIDKVTRLSGANRYITAVEISKSGWDSAGTVLLARGDDYADALAGVPLAYRLDAPILLTPTASLNSATKTEITRLGANKVILLGGIAAISSSVRSELTGMGLTVERIAGGNRYETAAEVAERLSAEGVNFDTAFIAVGTNFADALAASSYAAIRGEPILLVGTNTLPNATSTAFASLGITSTYVCGGTAAVSSEVYDQLPNPKRISGANRYATALALAGEFLPNEALHVGIATGLNFPDAVAGGVWAAKYNTGILLVNGSASEPGALVENFLEDRGITAVTLFGGPGAVSSEMEGWFDANLGD